MFVTAGAFASDAITIADAVTLNIGLRFDHSRAISQDIPVLDSQGRETDTTARGLGTLYRWNVWSPRLGLTMKLTGHGRTIMRASFDPSVTNRRTPATFWNDCANSRTRVASG